MAVSVGTPLPGGIPLLRIRSTAVDANTEDLGLADVYNITVADKTLTISAVHLTVDGRLFEVVGLLAEDGANMVIAEGALINGSSAPLSMTVNNASVIFRTFGGNLQVRSA